MSPYAGYQFPESFGAVGDGIADDSAAIMAAYAACTGRQSVYLSGAYGIGPAAALIFNTPNIGISSSPSAQFQALSGYSGPGVVLGPNMGGMSLSLPKINLFSGVALSVRCNLSTISSPQIQGNQVGLELYAAGTQGTIQNTVQIGILASNSVTAVQLTRQAGTAGAAIIEGNEVYVNFMNANACWTLFPASNAYAPNQIIENYFWCSAYECAGVHPNVMINKADLSQQVQNTWETNNGIYGFAVGDSWVRSSSVNGLDNATFDLGPGTQSPIGYACYVNPEGAGSGYGSTVKNCNGGRYPAAAAAVTAPASRSTFNAGQPPYTNRIPLSFPLGSLAPWATKTFYAYHPFVQGNARLKLEPDTQGASMLGMMVDSIADNSSMNANEIKIVLRNVSGVIQGGTAQALLTVGI